MARLAGAEKELLIEALLDAYPDYASLGYMLGTKLDDRPLARYAAPGPLDQVVFAVIGKAEAQGWTDELITGAALGNPGNAALRQLLGSGRLDPVLAVRAVFEDPTGPVQELLPQAAIFRDGFAAELEHVVNPAAGFQDVFVLAVKLMEVAGRVCCVEVVTPSGRSSGTGFLVGPDLVLTNHHVLAAQIAQPDAAPGVRCIFDYRITADAATDFGTPVGLASSWLVASSPPSDVDIQVAPAVPPAPDELDYALIRLVEKVGDHVMLDGRARGWFGLVPPVKPVFCGQPLMILQHPGTHPIKVAIDTGGVLGVNSNGTRITYGVNTLPGSSGAPCCSFDLELTALHHAGSRAFAVKRNEGIPIDVIAHHLRDAGHEGLLGG